MLKTCPGDAGRCPALTYESLSGNKSMFRNGILSHGRAPIRQRRASPAVKQQPPKYNAILIVIDSYSDKLRKTYS